MSWKLHASQLVIDNGIESLPSSVKEAVLLCCRRFGKSYYGCYRGTSKGIQSPRPRLTRIIGPTIKQTEMIVEYNMAKLTAGLEDLGLRGLVEHVKSDKMYRVGKSAIFLGGFDSQKDSLRGGEADEILLEESGSGDPDLYDYHIKSVLKPQLLKTRGRMIHLTTLPPLPDHPFITGTMEQAILDNAFYSYTIYEDPLATKEIIADAIKDSGGEHSDTFKREYLNIVIRDKSIVIIPDFDAALDVEEFDTPDPIKLEVYTDWGGVRDLTVSLLMGYDFIGGRDLVIDELSHPANTPTTEVVKAFKEKWGHLNLTRHVIDAPGQLYVDLQSQHKLTFTKPAKDDWETAINNVANRFTHRKVKVHPRCKLAIRTCQSGVFNKHRTDFDRSIALGHMDAMAALMYGIRSLDRSSPFGAEAIEHDSFFVRPGVKPPDIIKHLKIAKSTGYKKFG